MSPRPSRPWFRFYVEALYDPKLRNLPPATKWLFVAVLALARQSPVAGVLVVTETGPPIDDASIADAARMKPGETKVGLRALSTVGVIDRREDGAWYVVNWDDRQFEGDSSTNRARKSRSRQRGSNGETPFDATPPETEAETESPPGGGYARAPFEAEFEEVWYFWPKKLDKAHALAQYQTRRREGREQSELMRAVVEFTEHAQGVGTDVQYLPYLKTFIGKQGQWVEWLDGVPIDAVSNEQLGARAWAPEPPSGPSFVADHEQSRSVERVAQACPLGDEDCIDGYVDRVVDGRKTAVLHDHSSQAVSA